MKLHLAHMVPNKMAHGLNGYKEVIDTVQWGLRELGHSADYGLNTLSPTATNIVFGAQILTLELLESLAPDTIVYHFEQIRGQELDRLRPQARLIAERFRIWEYNGSNASVWAQLGAKDVRTVPIGYATILQGIEKPTDQDIDVLIYGSTSPDRLRRFTTRLRPA